MYRPLVQTVELLLFSVCLHLLSVRETEITSQYSPKSVNIGAAAAEKIGSQDENHISNVD